MKRAFLCPPITTSRALDRVRAALCADPRCGDDFPEEEADVVILQVVGRRDQVLRKSMEILKRGQKFAVIQYAMRSTKTPHTLDWRAMWEYATCVWSYLPLDQWSADDGTDDWLFNFYHAPLGVDAAVFHPMRTPRYRMILSSGRGWLTESIRECSLASKATGHTPVHLGEPLRGRMVQCYFDLPDHVLASLYSQCHYVSGLRRTEGFELPAAEGLLCGARPVLFDQPWYRDWYQDSAVYLHEGDRECVLNQLIALFKQPVQPVTQTERDEAARRFYWPTLVDGFLTRCLA